MALKFANSAKGILASSITTGSTTIPMQSGNGSLFPTFSGSGDYTYIVIEDSTGNKEIIKVNARSGDNLTVASGGRGQDGTVALAFSAGATVQIRPVAIMWDDMLAQALAASANTMEMTVVAKTANYTVIAPDDEGKLFAVDATTGNLTMTLPVAGIAGNNYVVGFKKTDASINTVTVDGDGSELIDTALTKVLAAQNDYVLIVSNGSKWVVISATEVLVPEVPLAVTVRVYTANNTWTKPVGFDAASFVIVEVVGGGGGGAGAAADDSSGGGGGGGYAREKIMNAALGATETVTWGAGGAGGAAGDNGGVTGGTSSFGAHLSATGGSGGSAVGAGGNGGQGGIGAGGDINVRGGAGGAGYQVGFQGGVGGNSVLGGGAPGGATGAGTVGGQYGGGGGGGSGNGAVARAGGQGAGGVVIVTEYIP